MSNSPPAPGDEYDCLSCGYSLFGLDDDRSCPECGLPIRLARSGHALKYADPDWIRCVSRGVLLMSVAFLLPFATLLLLTPVYLFLRFPPGYLGSVQRITVAALTGVALAVVPAAWGVWLLTTPNPALAQREPPLAPRRLARFALLVCLLGLLALVVVSLGMSWLMDPMLALLLVLCGLFSPMGLAGCVLLWNLTRYAEGLATVGRFSDRLKRGRVYRYGYLTCWLILAAGLSIAWGGLPSPLLCLAIPAGWFGLIFAALCLLLPVNVVGDFRRIAAAAQAARKAAVRPTRQ